MSYAVENQMKYRDVSPVSSTRNYSTLYYTLRTWAKFNRDDTFVLYNIVYAIFHLINNCFVATLI